MSRAPAFLTAALAWAAGIAGCATAKLTYTPSELRAELARTASKIPPKEIVVPYEVDEQTIALTRKLIRYAKSDTDRVRIITDAFSDPEIFGMRYAATVTADAEQTLKEKRGNCLALSSAFIAIARAAGLDAFYVDGSVRIHENRYEDNHGLTIDVGHVSVMIKTADEAIGLDFAKLGRVRWYRVISDLEALAHFYNNLGSLYLQTGELPRALSSFETAQTLEPDASHIHYNLAIARLRLGDRLGAIQALRQAIDLRRGYARARLLLDELTQGAAR